MRFCTEDGCEEKRAGRGLCSKHYAEWKRSGRELPPKPPREKKSLKSRLTRTRKSGDCLLWTGATKGTYGSIKVNGKAEATHRMSWEVHVGPLAADQCVLHKCDTRLCINPDHLFLGTYLTNAQDRNAKQREARGEGNGKHKLLATEVLRARARRAAGERMTDIHKDFPSVSYSALRQAINGDTWDHLNRTLA